jgi:hypothetical protein
MGGVGARCALGWLRGRVWVWGLGGVLSELQSRQGPTPKLNLGNKNTAWKLVLSYPVRSLQAKSNGSVQISWSWERASTANQPRALQSPNTSSAR